MPGGLMKLFLRAAAVVACTIAWLGLTSQAEAHTVYAPIYGSLVPIEGGEAQDPVEAPWGVAQAAAITPDGRKLYVADRDSGTYVIDTDSHQILAQIPGPAGASDIAISPRGDLAYVVSPDNGVWAIDTSEDRLLEEPVEAGNQPFGVAFAPDGERAYVTNANGISVIDTDTHDEVKRIADGGMVSLRGMAITPDGRTLYVANGGRNNVLAIDTDTGDVIATIAVGSDPRFIALTPDGKRAYVTNWSSNTVSVLDTTTNAVKAPIPVGISPNGIATAPDGKRAYVALDEGAVSVIDTATNAVEKMIFLGRAVRAVVAVPNQPPAAELRVDALEVPVGKPVTFEVSASDEETEIASYTFDFGDGSQVTTAQPKRKHAHSEPGTYSATVTVDDGVGCEPIPEFFELGLASPFTGHTAHCNGPSRVTSKPVKIRVVAPGLRLRVDAKRRQRSLRRVQVTARCEGADCRVRAGGALQVKRPGRKAQRFALIADARELKAGAKSRLELRIPAQARRAARKALKEGGKVRAKLRVRATGPAGQERVRVRVVRIVRR